MIQYYPLTRIKQNLYTRGGEYRLPNGEVYKGKYYLTFEGNAYTGANPFTGQNEFLEKIKKDPSQAVNLPAPSLVYTLAITNNSTASPQDVSLDLKELPQYFPIPTEEDYKRGYFNRYFAKNYIGNIKIIEISETTYSDIKNGFIDQTFVLYEIMTMLWQLTGPKEDTRVSQYQVKGGVATTNKRVTEGKEPSFTGIINYIGGDYTKFARITNP